MWLVVVHPYDSRHRQKTITLREAEYHGDGRSGVLEGKYEFLRADRNKLRKVARRRQEQLLKAPLAIEESLQDPNTLYQICEAHYEPLSDEMPDKFEDTRYAHYLEKERSRTSAGGDDFAVPTIDKPPDNLRMFLSTLFAREPIFPNLSTNRVINLHQPCSGRRFAGGPVLSRPILWHHPRHVFPVPVPR